ncbi:MAG TPA: glycosyltransferase [Candidatus Limnocylindria bacterium]|nr:glycosyltransferase [Candidatus Limnocylindria bacterium]
MHVAFLTDVALPYVSGVTVAVRRQRDALRESGVRVTVVGPHGDVDVAESDIHVPGAPAGHRLALFGPRLPTRLRSLQVELLHAHSVFGASWAALAAARSLRVPFVVTVHTRFDEYAHYAGLAAPLARTLVGPYTGAVVAAADLAIAPNEELAAELRAAGDARAVSVVAAPIEATLCGGDAARGRDRLGAPAGVPLLLSASRLAVEKRVLDLIALLRASAHRDAVLVFAGSGPLEPELRAAAAAAGLAPRVLFAGQLGLAALADAFAAADLVVSASRSETQGLALCEAAAAGRVVVAPDRGGYAEVLGHGTGGLFPSPAPSAEELAGCVDLLLDGPAETARMGREAARRAEVAWSPRAVAASLRAAYDAASRVTE